MFYFFPLETSENQRFTEGLEMEHWAKMGEIEKVVSQWWTQKIVVHNWNESVELLGKFPLIFLQNLDLLNIIQNNV